MELDFMGIPFYMSGHDLTIYDSMFKSPCHQGSLNCQCDLVTHSSPTMDPFSHGDTIPLIFSAVYDIYSDISDPHELFYIFLKVIHQIGKKIHDFIHDMEATHEADFVESFDVI